MKIQWTEPAVDDLESLHEYIGRDSEVYAVSFIEKVLSTVDILEEMPEIGRMVPEAKDANIRRCYFKIIESCIELEKIPSKLLL